MKSREITIDETHIRLTTDLENVDLKNFIFKIRNDLKRYISTNKDFLLSLEPIKCDVSEESLIVRTMYESSVLSDVGPMACVAGTISELSINYLIGHESRYSIVENGGDISLINDEKVLCGIYSNNDILGNNIAFELKPRKKALGICTSSGKIGHSISFGYSDSVTVIAKSSSIADALATRIANDVVGEISEDKVSNALECGDNYRNLFDSLLIISDNHVGSIGKLPKIVETNEFDVKI